MTKRQTKRISFAESLILGASPSRRECALEKPLKSVLKVRDTAAESYRADLPLEKVTLLNTPQLKASALARLKESPLTSYMRDEQQKFYNKLVKTGVLELARPYLPEDFTKRVEAALDISDYEIVAAIARSGRFALDEYTESFEELFESVAEHLKVLINEESKKHEDEVGGESPTSDSTADSPPRAGAIEPGRARVAVRRSCARARRQQRLARLRKVGFFR